MAVRLLEEETNTAEDEIMGEESNRPHPLTPISELLWKIDREFNKVQDDYILADEIFEWYITFTEELRRFRRIAQTTTTVTER